MSKQQSVFSESMKPLLPPDSLASKQTKVLEIQVRSFSLILVLIGPAGINDVHGSTKHTVKAGTESVSNVGLIWSGTQRKMVNARHNNRK